MRRWWREVDVTDELRWLGAPVTVFCLAVMVLNDHVLKQAWPGLVTGKLSDVAGLVVAPPLVALVLALARVSRAGLVALLATGMGFVLAKSTQTGSEIATVVWSQFGFPGLVRRDPTDLAALPALVVAAHVRRVVARPREQTRRKVQVVVGAAVLPFAVVATAATSCGDWGEGVRSVAVVSGDFVGAPSAREQVLVVDTGVGNFAVGGVGEVRHLADADSRRLGRLTAWTFEACDPSDPLVCWRTEDDQRPWVEMTADGGRTWEREYEMSEEEAEDLLDDLGERCGDLPRFRPQDLSVLGTADGPIVAVAAEQAGLLLRMPGQPWRRVSSDELRSTGLPPLSGSARGPLTVEDPRPSSESESPSPSQPPCPSPTRVTISPDPRNGAPFRAYRCPDGTTTSRADQ